MRAVVLDAEPRTLRVVSDWPEPEPGPGEVLVRVRGVGICGSDLALHAGRRQPPSFPWVVGHETFGEIAATGPGVERGRTGQRVVVEPNIPCGSCPACRQAGPQPARTARSSGSACPARWPRRSSWSSRPPGPRRRWPRRPAAGGLMTTAAEALAAQLESYGVRVRVRHLRAHQHRAAGRARPELDQVRHRAARAGGGARRRRVRPGVRPARRAAAARRAGDDERGHWGGHRRARLGTPGGDQRRRALLLRRAASAPGGQPARGRRPDRRLPAVHQAGLACAPGRGPAPVHRTDVLDRHLGPTPSRRPGSRAAATRSRSARSGSWPTCGTRSRPTRC